MFEYAEGATPLDPDEASGLIQVTLRPKTNSTNGNKSIFLKQKLW
ncbi:hypothetical protein COXBURSA331_0040 (plasmid) [Coxiella burnetii RSA 331]|nr:hypothetical protein COXBURSA331_0040 [Coxiella burnetii RSA 331]